MTEINSTKCVSRTGGILGRWVLAPVDIAALAFFRILFGLLMAAAMIRFLAKGWVTDLYVAPKFHFPYEGFSWVHPLPDGWMQAHFVLLAILALMVAVGFLYRAATILFFLGFAYVELIDQTAFLNHYYLVSLLSGLLMFMPAHRAWSVDVWRCPSLKLDVVPGWTINLLRFQIAVVYTFAGLAKVNPDWLLAAQPLRIWLAARSDLLLVGPWLQPVWVAYAASWFGAIYDLSIAFFLLRPRTRKFAFMAVVFFHLGTWILFNIGMFPWIMIAASSVFFRPDWPRVRLQQLGETAGRWFRFSSCAAWGGKLERNGPGAANLQARKPRLLFPLLISYATVQLLLPLRPYFFNRSSHPAWSYRGFNLSWQVLVAEKTGYVEFYARDRDTKRLTRIRPLDYITLRQESLMAQDPHLIRAFSKHLAADRQASGKSNFDIIANAFATINGHPSQPIVRPGIDLARCTGSEWILPAKF